MSTFAQDVRLVFSNCKLYNEISNSTEFVNLAESYSKIFEDKMQKLHDAFGELSSSLDSAASTTNYSSSNNGSGSSSTILAPSLANKTKVSKALFKLKSEELGHVVRMIELQYSSALMQSSSNISEGREEEETLSEVEINIDALPADVFSNVLKYCNEQVSASRSSITKRKR
jgi:hypothetical protein